MGSFVKDARDLLQLEAQKRDTPLPPAIQARRRQLLQRVVEQLQQRGSGPSGQTPPARTASSKSPQPEQTDRRRFLRVPGPLQVRFRTGEASLVARAEELALGGFSLGEPIWVVAGQQLQTESVRVGSADYPLRTRCRVVWRVTGEARIPCCGFEFADLDDEIRGQIRTIFEALLVAYLESLPEVAEKKE